MYSCHNHKSSITIILPAIVLFLAATGIPHVQARRNPFLPSSLTRSSTKKGNNSNSNSNNNSNNNKYYKIDDDEEQPMFVGSGREFDLFGERGGDSSYPSSGTSSSSTSSSSPYRTNVDYYRKRKSPKIAPTKRGNYYKSYSSKTSSSSSSSSSNKSILSSIKEWITNGNLPKIQCRVEPNTTLKVRKTFRPLKTIVQLGADFNTQLGVWQFTSSWEDDVIGGKLTLAGRELQFSKTWLLSVGAVEDLVTRLRLRAAVDLGTMKAYARLGFRTERLSPINVVEGFTMVKRLPLDGNDGHVKLEVKANFAFPEPEIEYSTENHRSFVGMGDIEINIDELNLLLSY